VLGEGSPAAGLPSRLRRWPVSAAGQPRLCHRLVWRAASESGSSRHGDGAEGATKGGATVSGRCSCCLSSGADHAGGAGVRDDRGARPHALTRAPGRRAAHSVSAPSLTSNRRSTSRPFRTGH